MTGVFALNATSNEEDSYPSWDLKPETFKDENGTFKEENI